SPAPWGAAGGPRHDLSGGQPAAGRCSSLGGIWDPTFRAKRVGRAERGTTLRPPPTTERCATAGTGPGAAPDSARSWFDRHAVGWENAECLDRAALPGSLGGAPVSAVVPAAGLSAAQTPPLDCPCRCGTTEDA